MYPFLRLVSVTLSERRKPAMALFDTHVLPLRCLPADLDGFFEMNNGRVLTLYDLGRFALSIRVGLWDVLRREGWGLVVAGSSVRTAPGHGLQRYPPAHPAAGWTRGSSNRAGIAGADLCNHGVAPGVTQRAPGARRRSGAWMPSRYSIPPAAW